jgi:hypothetical protein
MQGEEPNGRIAAFVDQQIAAPCRRQMLNG